MSKAEKLLDSLSDGEPVVHLADQLTEGHIVIDADRIITVPDELKRLAVQYDHNIETVMFDCPRYWDEHDMSKMSIYINYLRVDGFSGTYRADNVEVDTEDSSIMHFNWTISKNVTMMAGKLVFIVCIRKIDTDGNEKNHWNSELCKDCYVSDGLEYAGENLEEVYPDLIEQWNKEVAYTLDAVETTLGQMVDSGRFDGATFTPSVSDTCELSWTNNKGLENPETVNIRGKDAVSPTIEVDDIQAGHRVTITDVNGVKSFDVMDTVVNTTDAVNEMFNRFVYIGSIEPTSTPCIWLDTTPKDELPLTARYLEGTIRSDYNGIITFPEIDFIPNTIVLWNISRLVDDENVYYDGLLLVGVYDNDEKLWITQSIGTTSNSTRITNNYGDSSITVDDNVYSYGISLTSIGEELEFNYAIYG